MFESMGYPEHDAPHDFYRLMPEGLRHLGAEAGLQVRECVRLGGLFTRFACLWNNFLMHRMKHPVLLRPFGHLGVLSANLVCYMLDGVFSHPRLASDVSCGPDA